MRETGAEAAKILARGESPAKVLAALSPAVRDLVAGLLRSCGERMLSLEERSRQLESSLVDLRLAARGYSRLKRELAEENEELRAQLGPGLGPIIGAGGGLREAMELVARVIDTPISVLVTGESGTGKEVIARHLHERGPREDGPFVAINCAALPEGILESELFGIERGVATGVESRAGKFEEADGGTLFLDEVADMTPAVQAKILRALQEREVVHLGGREPVKVDVRIIAATNKDLAAEVRARRFREDLYYRLVGVHIHLPPLRERRRDVDALLEHFLGETARRFGRQARRFSPAALAALRSYAWPGNVRELIVEVERAVALARTDTVELGDLTPKVAGTSLGSAAALAPAGPGNDAAAPLTLKEARRRFEVCFIQEALARAGSRRKAAKLLGLTVEGLRKRLEALDFSPPVATAAPPRA